MEYKVVKVEFAIWAKSEEEGDVLKEALTDFINEHAAEGRRVTARKVVEAIRNWRSNVLVQNAVVRYFREE